MGNYIMDLRKIVGHRALIMPCACVILGDGKGNVLLQLRVDDNTWAIHGGSIELDEKVEDAMKREVKEELNLDVLDYQLLGVYSGPEHHHTYPNGDETSCIDIVYVCHKFSGTIKIQEDEVQKVEWFNKHSLPACLAATAKKWLNEYFIKLENKEFIVE